MTRRQAPDCASDLRLDQLLAGELPAREAEGLRAHLAECLSCRGRREALDAAHGALMARLPAFTALEQAAGVSGGARLDPAPAAPRRRAVHSVWLAAGSLAAALALWVVARERLPSDSAERAGVNVRSPIRTKGGSGVQLDWVIRRGAELFAPGMANAWQPGDRLRFGVRTNRAGYAAVLSLDAGRQASVYQDWVPVTAGERQLLPGAVELDGVLGDEHLYGLVCERSVPLATLEGAIRRAPAHPELPAGCAVDHHVVRKERP
jgi:hypothetical protein